MRQIDVHTTFQVLKDEFFFTYTRLEANPDTNDLKSYLEPLLPRLRDLETKDEVLWLRTLHTQAGMSEADRVLNRHGRVGSRLLLNLVQGDRSHPTFRRFFGNKTPSVFLRPVLGDKLVSMAGWVDPMSELGSAPLTELAQKIKDAVGVAQRSIQADHRAEEELKDLRLLGLRKIFVDDFDAARSRLYGLLAEMVSTRPELNLPKNFADLFFLKRPRKRTKPLTPEEELSALYEQREAINARIAELEDAQKQQAEKAKRAAEVAQEIADLEAQKQALEDRVTKLENDESLL